MVLIDDRAAGQPGQPGEDRHVAPPRVVVAGHATGSTVLPPRDPMLVPATRRRTGGVSRDGLLNFVGSLGVGVCLAILLFGRLAPFSGLIGFVAVAYAGFLVSYGVLVSLSEDRSAVRDRLATVMMASAAVLLISALVDIVIFTALRGSKAVVHVNFFSQDLTRAGPLQPLSIGGVQHAIVGTLIMISIALIITVPVGLVCAVYLNEVRNPFSRFVRTIVEAMTALPSILAGLFIFDVWELRLHRGPSGFAAAMAMSIMMLPIIIRASDVVLRLVPGNLKEASAALGAPAWRTMWHVVLPTARSGLTTAVILGMARGLGETSPVLLTAGYTYGTNLNPFKGSMVSLPLVAFELIKSGLKGLTERGFAAAFFLLIIVIVLFAVARAIGGRGPGQLSKRQAARVRRESARDRARFIGRAATSAPDAETMDHPTPRGEHRVAPA